MKRKDGFVLREVCGEKVIVGEGLGAIDFGKLISLNDTAAWIWEKAGELGEFNEDAIVDALCARLPMEEVKLDFLDKIVNFLRI